MSLLSKRLVSIAASTVLLSLVSAAANAQAQIDLFTSNSSDRYNWGVPLVRSTYNFTESMILNSIGFATEGTSNIALSYQVNGGGYTFVDSSLLGTTDSNGFRWYQLGAGQTMQAGTTLEVRMTAANPLLANGAGIYKVLGTNSAAKVSYLGLYEGTGTNLTLTNSNLRVSNPGSNVAPEPGSFALALTGGAALLGICVRRRRIAG